MGSCCSKKKPQTGDYIRYHDSKKKNPKMLGHSIYDEPNILIIGAGVAGLACAVELQKKGFERVRIIEMADRIGGRIRTMKFADNCIDLGAQMVQGRDGNIVHDMVADLDVLSTTKEKFSRLDWIRSNGDKMSRDLTVKLILVVSNIIRNKQFDGECKLTFGEYLVEKFSQEMLKAPFQSFSRTQAAEFLRTVKKLEGNHTDLDMCASAYESFSPCSGGMFNWRDKGFKNFLHYLVNGDEMNEQGQLKNCIDLNTRVLQIEWDRVDGSVGVTCQKEKHYIADHVVITVPLGVLKKNHNLFVPCLPQAKRKAINFLGFGTVCKIFIEFEDPWWHENWPGFYAMWRSEDLNQPQLEWVSDIYAFHRYAFQPRVLLGWATGPYTEVIETIDSKLLTQGILFTLRRFLPKMKISHPKKVLTSRWSIDPAHLGVYSYPSMLTTCYNSGYDQLAQPVNLLTYAPEHGKLWPNTVPMSVRPILLFAGEATSSTHFSTVHGALESGLREAHRLHGYYQKAL